jgi:hypothetical protein
VINEHYVLTHALSRETNAQGLLLDVIQKAAPEAYEKRTKRQGIVNAFDDENFANAVRGAGSYPPKISLTPDINF